MRQREINSYDDKKQFLFRKKLNKPEGKQSPIKAKIFGFDTEYNPKTNELYSVQLTYKANNYFFDYRDKELKVEGLFNHVKDILSKNGEEISKLDISNIILVSFFSIAEAQHLSYMNMNVREWGKGNYDFSKYINHQGKRFNLQIIDLQVWFRGNSLSSVADKFGLRKKHWDFDKKPLKAEFVDTNPLFDENKEHHPVKNPTFKEYANHDSFICEQVFSKLRNEFLNEFQVDILRKKTPAGVSSFVFRRDYMEQEIIPTQSRIRDLALKCSWGGYNIAFKRGNLIKEEGFYEYDAVSMYANALIEGLKELPIQYEKGEENGNWLECNDIDSFLDKRVKGGLCKVKFEFPEDTYYPCLPVASEGAEYKLIYPLKGVSHCSREEVKLAKEMGAELEIMEGRVYLEGTTSLTDYLKDMLNKKKSMTKSADFVRRTLFKMMMNSVIGKMSQKIYDYDINELRKVIKDSELTMQEMNTLDDEDKEKVLANEMIFHKQNKLNEKLKKATEKEEIETINNKLEFLDTLIDNPKKYKEYYDMPLEKKLSLGSMFYPEWSALILGYARATLARAFWKKGAVAGTTDSFITNQDPAKDYDLKVNKKTGKKEKIGYFNCNNIRFEYERKAKRITIARTRLYQISNIVDYENIDFDNLSDKEWKELEKDFSKQGHLAFHAINNRKKALEFLLNPKFDKVRRKYKDKKMYKLRESIKKDKNLAETEELERTVKMTWDWKRKLTGITTKAIKLTKKYYNTDNKNKKKKIAKEHDKLIDKMKSSSYKEDSRAWQSIEEYQNFIEEYKDYLESYLEKLN